MTIPANMVNFYSKQTSLAELFGSLAAIAANDSKGEAGILFITKNGEIVNRLVNNHGKTGTTWDRGELIAKTYTPLEVNVNSELLQFINTLNEILGDEPEEDLLILPVKKDMDLREVCGIVEEIFPKTGF